MKGISESQTQHNLKIKKNENRKTEKKNRLKKVEQERSIFFLPKNAFSARSSAFPNSRFE